MQPDERTTRAYLELVGWVVLFVRLRSRGENRLTDEHLFDLMDAVHNIPEFLKGTNSWFTPDRMRLELESYDERWSENGGLHLVKKLDEALSQGARK